MADSELTRLWRRIFRFLASLKLAVIVLLGLAVVLAVATVVEARYDTKTAQHLVYGSPAFMILLGFLGINVACAALIRFPWRRRQIGFVATHAGIIVILIGAFVTAIWGVDGSVPLTEGESSNMVLLDRPILQVEFPGRSQSPMILPAEFRWRPPMSGREFVRSLPVPSEGNTSGRAPQLRLAVDQYVHRAVQEETVTDDGERPNPALRLVLASSRAAVDQWLFPSHPERRSLHLGPARVRALAAESLDATRRLLDPPRDDADRGRLLLLFPAGERAIPVAGNIGKPLALPGLPFTVTITRYLPHAVVDRGPNGMRLVSKSTRPINPCVEFTLSGPNGEESHVAFARFPHFPTLHGEREGRTPSGVKARYEFAPEEGRANGHELLLIFSPSGEILYRVIGGKAPRTGTVRPGTSLPTGWMDMTFTVTEVFRNARSLITHRPAADKGAADPAIHAIVRGGREAVGFWLKQGEARVISVDGEVLKVAYGNEAIPLPFSIQLEKFTIGRDPGSSRPASFTSDVIVNHPGVYLHRKASIFMNHPLKWGGYTFYQASYQETPGEPTVSVLSAGYDPGRGIKYAGSILLVLGIATMFYMKKFLAPLERKGRGGNGSNGGRLESVMVKSEMTVDSTVKRGVVR